MIDSSGCNIMESLEATPAWPSAWLKVIPFLFIQTHAVEKDRLGHKKMHHALMRLVLEEIA